LGAVTGGAGSWLLQVLRGRKGVEVLNSEGTVIGSKANLR